MDFYVVEDSYNSLSDKDKKALGDILSKIDQPLPIPIRMANGIDPVTVVPINLSRYNSLDRVVKDKLIAFSREDAINKLTEEVEELRNFKESIKTISNALKGE